MTYSLEEKLAFNSQLETQADAEKGALQSWLDSLRRPSSEDRSYYRDQVRLIDERVKKERLQIESKDWGQNISIRSSTYDQIVCYGEQRLGGLISFMNADQGDTGQFFHLVVTLVAHEIDRFTQLYLDGQRITFNDANVDGQGRKNFGWATGEWLNYVFCSVKCRGANDQAANSDLVSQSAALFPGLWTSAHRQRHHAHIYLILKYDVLKFPNGLPEIAVELRGKNNIYDPRDESTGYSNNAALCLVNFLTSSRFGPGFSIDDFDLDNIAEAADICDESVPKKGGGSVARYTCNGSFYTNNSSGNWQAIKQQMELAFAGSCTWSEGKFWLYPGKWRSPVVSLSEKDLRSSVNLSIKPSKQLIFNSVKGQYRGPESGWETTEYPFTKNDTYIEQDGEQLFKEIDHRFTISPAACQRINKIKLEDARQWIQLQADFGMKAYPVRAGENVQLSLEQYGFESKYFRVLERTERPLVGSDPATVALVLKETAPGIYDWNNGEETTIDLAPNTTLPSPSSIYAPKNLALEAGTEELEIRADNTVFSRIKVSWDASVDLFVTSGGFHEIQFKRSDSSTWRTAGFVSGTESNFYILDVQDGVTYDVRVRAITPVARSTWTEELGFLVQGKLENPSTVQNFRAIPTATGILLTWDSIPDLDVAAYEIRLGESWSAGTVVFFALATEFRYSPQAAGTYKFFLRARDNSVNRNYSFDSAVVEFQVAAPGPVRNLSGLAIYNIAKLTWQEPTTGSFPVVSYKILVGDTYASAVLQGSVQATFKMIQESESGARNYWVVPVDTYGNEGTPRSVSVQVNSPPQFVLLTDTVLLPAVAEEVTNAAVEDLSLVAPVFTEKTYSQHFTENGWNTPQDQIAAGYPIFIQPANTVESTVRWVYDFGEEIESCRIVLQYFAQWAAGSGTITPTLGFSSDGVAFTEEADVTTLVGTSFQYVSVEFVIEGDDDKSVVRMSDVRLRLEVTTEKDAGVVSALSTDALGTLVTFNKTVLDIVEGTVDVGVLSNSAYFVTAVVTGNEIRVFCWNTSGARVSASVKWSADVVVAA